MNETKKSINISQKKGLNHPIWTFILTIFPQSIMVSLFLQGYYLIHGNMNSTESNYAITIIVLMSLNILALTLFSIYKIIRKRLNGILFYVMLLCSQIIILWILCKILNQSIPSSVDNFIFPSSRYAGYLFTFMMPGIFYGITGIANAITLKNWRTDIILTVGGVFGTPLILYLISIMFRIIPGMSNLMTSIPTTLIISSFLLLTVMFFIFLMRMFAKTFSNIDKREPYAKFLLVFMISIVLPIGGLLLNITIPFPVDLQDWRVYAMTILNGIILCIPVTGIKKIDLLLFAGKGILYPFSIYFFLIFLPYLPLSLIAIIMIGVGFLMLSPTALFFIHTKKIVVEFISLSKSVNKLTLSILLFCCIMTIPVFITVNALLDRRVIYKAVNYVYNSDYTEEVHIGKELPRIQRSLQALYNFKHGIEMPYITLYYQWLVFDNLVLPDKKIRKIYKDLFGEELEKEKASMFGREDFFRWSPQLRGLNVREKDPSIKIISVSKKITKDGNGYAKCMVDIELKNEGERSLTEYISEIRVPEGVFVSGYYLKIGETNVPGRLFEKKSALWIYEKITNVRQDPGLLYYIAPRKLKFHVFPFNSREIRYTGIEFIFPESVSHKVMIDNQTIILENTTRTETADQPPFTIIGKDNVSGNEIIKRNPVLHFIIDYSTSAKELDFAKLAAIGERFECSAYNLSFANVNSSRVAENQDVKELSSIQPTKDKLPEKTGGFMLEKALKREILLWYKMQSRTEFPIFIIVTDNEKIFNYADYKYFNELIPETEYIYVSSFSGDLKSISLRNGKQAPFSELVINDTSVLKNGLVIANNNFFVVSKNQQSQNEYLKAVSLMNDYKKIIYNPSIKEANFAKLVYRSKDSGIMIPITSYIVLESAAQWAMLEKTEKDKLGNLSELEIEEIHSPEPGFFTMILAFFAGMGILKFITKRQRKESEL